MTSPRPDHRPFRLLPALLAALALALPAQAADGESGLRAKPDHIDFGEAFQGEVLEQEVTFTNRSGDSWPVGRIQTSCGCTVAKIFGPDGTELPTRMRDGSAIVTLAEGQTMKTKVEFRTAGKHGKIQQQMQVYSTDESLEPASVPVHVQVSRALSINPSWVNLGNVGKLERVERTVTIDSLDIGDWSITGFESQIEGQPLPDYVSFEVASEEGTTREVKVVIDGERPVGAISPRVRVTIDHPRVQYVDFTITGIVQPNVTFNSGHETFKENISFDQLTPEDTVKRTLTIENAEPTVPYTLESVELLTPHKDFFTTEIRTLEEGLTYAVDVTVDGAIDTPFFRGSLVLKADHPDVPSKTIPFHGWVRK